MKTRHTLIIEDIPLLRDFYQDTLRAMSGTGDLFSITVVHSFKTLVNDLKIAAQTQAYDMVVLDIRLVDHITKEHYDGETFGIHIRQLMPKTKILVITEYDDSYRCHTIFQNLNPDGFMAKSSLTVGEFKKAVGLLLNGQNYYCPTVSKYVKRNMIPSRTIDDLDRSILHFLSNHFTLKEISKQMPLSISGIEKRKRNLAQFFDLEDNTTASLVQAAKKHGFIG